MAKETKRERYLKFHLDYVMGTKYSNCPFCGHKPREILSRKEEKKVACENKDCCLFNHEIPAEKWESRISEYAAICEICGRQSDGDDIGGCNKCSLTVCSNCVSEEGWCLECIYDFGGAGKK